MESKEKNFRPLSLIKFLIIFLIFLYLISCVYKISVISYIMIKSGTYKDLKSYSYYHIYKSYINSEIDENGKALPSYEYEDSYYINFQDNIQFVENFGDVYPNRSIISTWYYFDKDTKSTYSRGITDISKIEDNESVPYDYYFYSEGFANRAKTPYELVNDEMKPFYKLSFIFNPFKSFKIDLNYDNIIFERYEKEPYDNVYYQKETIYINLSSALLDRIDRFELDEKKYCDIYKNYNIDNNQIMNLELSEEEKSQIIQKAAEQRVAEEALMNTPTDSKPENQ